jgi:RNA polymerase sigma factor (sigma-70 family)
VASLIEVAPEAAPPLPERDLEGPSDERLVAAVRRGDDRAFERLYQRYCRRIQAYVVGMCKDHARAEDITQEVFVSALRRMRETERPIAFKPWIYEIAKNACIDQHRRSRRAEEVSLQDDDGLAPGDYGRLVNSGPTPDVAVAAKQDLDHLCGAFGGLSETHHEILVMRELEGLSYREIGERLGMSRPAVESTLFRARRRLTEEYDELVSGVRCLRIQGIIATAGRGRIGARDTSRLARHVAHCQPCRREAVAAGVDAAVLRPPLRTRVAAKVAALLPFPLFGRRFGRGADDPAALVPPTGGWAANLPLLSDHLGAGWTKAAAATALLLAGAGAGVGARALNEPTYPEARPSAPARPAESATSRERTLGAPATATAAAAADASAQRAIRNRLPADRRHSGLNPVTGTAADRALTPSTPAATSGGHPSPATHAAGGAGMAPTQGAPVLTPAEAVVPATVPDAGTIVEEAAGAVIDVAGAVGGAADDALGGAIPPVTGIEPGTAGTVPGLVP